MVFPISFDVESQAYRPQMNTLMDVILPAAKAVAITGAHRVGKRVLEVLSHPEVHGALLEAVTRPAKRFKPGLIGARAPRHYGGYAKPIHQ